MSNTVREMDKPSQGIKKRFQRSLWVGVVLINAAVILLGLWLYRDRSEATAEQIHLLTSNYAQILDGNLAGTFEKIDLALTTVVDEVEQQERDGGIRAQRLLDFLKRQDSYVPETLGLRVSDADGWIQYSAVRSSTSEPWKPVDIRDRPHFLALRDGPPDSGLYISKPVVSKISQKPIIALARRHNKPDGSFGGIVYAAVPISYFVSKLSQLDLGKRGNSGLWLSTTLIARYSPADSAGASSGAKTPSKELQNLIASGKTDAQYHTVSRIDGIERDYHFRKISRYPLYLVVGIAGEDYQNQLRQELLTRFLIISVLMLGTVALAWQLHRNWLRLSGAQQKLAELNDALLAQHAETEQAKQRSEMILSAAGEGICGVDRNGKIIFINPSARAMFGWTADKGIGIDLHEATHHHHEDGSLFTSDNCPIKATLNDGLQRKIEEDTFWREDGTAFPVSYTIAPLTAEGRIIGAVNIFHDISERKETERELEAHRNNLEALVAARTSALMETEARASMILNSSADGLYGIDQRGIILFANAAACHILGYQSPEQLIGQSAHQLFHHSHADGSVYAPGHCPSYRSLRDGIEVRVVDEVYWHADGRPIPVIYATHPMHKDGEIVGAVTSFIDATEQRAAADARERALQAAEKLARTRSEFIANMSHEIRTPLNGVMGFATIGLRQADNPAKVLDAFTKIKESGNRLLGVINDILDFSKIEAGKLQIKHDEVDVRKLVQQTSELLGERLEAKGLALHTVLATDLPSICLCDELRLGQVLLNVLSNAVKFTESGSITLSVTQDGGQLHFAISDTGIGMSEEQVASLFTPFYQADTSSSRRYGGTGLGLVISQRLVELMGGEIRVNSSLGHGSQVDFHIPLSLPAGQSPAKLADDTASPGKPSPLQGVTVLAVDDEPINRMVLEEILLDAGASVVMAEGGQEALDSVRQHPPGTFDIVLMDLQMPGIGGYAATEILHRIDPELPVIAQTAHAFSEERARCLAAGMKAHITKPFNPDELIDLVRQHALPSRTKRTCTIYAVKNE